MRLTDVLTGKIVYTEDHVISDSPAEDERLAIIEADELINRTNDSLLTEKMLDNALVEIQEIIAKQESVLDKKPTKLFYFPK